LRGETELNSNIQTVPDDTIYNIEKNEELDPGSTGEIYGTSLGQINTKNYADYNTELLAVAVICTDESSTNIDDLLAEASDREVYAFIDRFEFSTWGSLLLDDSMDIRYYDVVFVSDQELTSSQYTWDESWELTPMQRHKLETFIFAGGSIYFSSSINNQESWLRDRYMPVTEIQARTNNRIANSNFDKGMPFIKSNTFVLDSCDETDEWYEAINGEGNTWEWDRSHGESYLSGERTGDKMRFGIPFENENSHHVAISASSDKFTTQNYDKYKISTKIKPTYFNPKTIDQTQGEEWCISTKIADGKWAKIGYDDYYSCFLMGVSNTMDYVTHSENWVDEYYHESDILHIERNSWHTLEIGISHITNGISTIHFIINGKIESIMEINPEDSYGFETHPDLVDINLAIYSTDRDNPDGFLWLTVDYVEIDLHDYQYDYNWDSNSETYISAHKGYGEFAVLDEMDGIFPNCLHLGIKKRKIDGEWFFDSYRTDLSLMINQTIHVPNSFVNAYFHMDYKKLTSLESDRLDFLLFDENDKLIHTVPINNDHYLDVNWSNTGDIDLTQYLRGQAGKTIKVVIWVHGTNTRIRVGNEETYIDTYAEFKVDRPELFFIGGKAKVPIYIVYDSTSYGYNINKDLKLPFASVDPYRSFYFAEELMAKLVGDGMLNTHQINIAQLKNILTLNQQCVVINTHPLPESIYNGSVNSPLIKWISSDAGIFIDTMEEPLGYFIDEDEYILMKVDDADLEIFGYDLIKSYEYRDFSSYLWYGNWQYRKTIMINNPTTTELIDYPIYLKVTKEPEMQTSFEDIRFTTKNGLMLDYELESCDEFSGHFWVRLPYLSNSSTEIFMYYGNPDALDFSNKENVWDDNYNMVQHFEETTSTAIVTDSTMNECHFTDNVNPILDSIGKVGSGVEFGASNFLKESTGYSELVGQTESTVSFWMSKNDNTYDPDFIFDWNDEFRLSAMYDRSLLWTTATSETSPNLGYSTTGNWFHISITWDGTIVRYYKNGIERGTDIYTGSMGTDTSGPFTIGQISYYPSSNYYLNGMLDEFRQSNIARDSSWIKADYEFMTNQELHVDVSERVGIGITEEEYQLFYLENFDDKITEVENVTDEDFEILLDDYIGGYLSLAGNTSYSIIESVFENPVKAHESIEYETVFLHSDLYLTNTTTIKLKGRSTDGTNITFICVLGENFSSYTDNSTNTFYVSIPFNTQDNPSELIENSWNSILINLDQITDLLGADKAFDLIYSIEFNCTESIKLDNIWIGRCGSTMQKPAEWVVAPFKEFTSDYPVSLSILEQMKREIPGFSFAVFGRSEGVRKLIFREDFIPDIYPENDLWTEELFEYWQVSSGGVIHAEETNVCNGNYSLFIQLTGTQIIELSLNDTDFDIGPYTYLNYALMTNSTITDYTWINEQTPILQLVDNTNETLSFEIAFEETNRWLNSSLIIDQGINSGLFDLNDFEHIRLVFPKNGTEDVNIFIDSMYFETSLNKDIWTWEGFLPKLMDYIEFEVYNETIWFETLDEFGLGTFEFLNEFDPLSNVEFGLTSNGYGEILFHYSTKISKWWDTNWAYNRNITIQNQNEELEDYQILVTLDNTTNIYSNTQANGYDIRFVNGTSGYSLDFWIEEWNPTGTSRVWVEIPKMLPYQIANISMYYGNPNALPCSDGRATFDFFDDFSYSFLDLERWNVDEYVAASHYYESIDGELHVHANSYGAESGYDFETIQAFNMSSYALHVETSWSDLLYREAYGIYNGITLITDDDNRTGYVLGLDGANQNVLKSLNNDDLLDYIDIGNLGNGLATYDYLFLNDQLKLNLTGSYSYSEIVNITAELTNFRIRLSSYVDWISGSSPRIEAYFDLVYLRKVISNEPIVSIVSNEMSYTNAEYSYLKAIIRKTNGNQEKQIIFEEGFNPSKPHVYKIVREENSIIFIIDDRPVSIFESNLPIYTPPSHKVAYTISAGKMRIHWIKVVERQPYTAINYNAMILDGYGTTLYEEFEYRHGFPETEGNYNENEWWYVPGLNNDVVTTSLGSYDQNNWGNTFSFEYDGDTCPPQDYGWQKEAIERQFSSVLDFNCTSEVDWWQENNKGGRKFVMYLYNVDQNLQYSPIGFIALADGWAANSGKYQIKLGDTLVSASAPLVGPDKGVIFEVIRDGNKLNATIYSHDKSTIILTLTITNTNVLPLNSIQLHYNGIWGSCMTPTYSPSHSIIWIYSFEVSGIGTMFPTTCS